MVSKTRNRLPRVLLSALVFCYACDSDGRNDDANGTSGATSSTSSTSGPTPTPTSSASAGATTSDVPGDASTGTSGLETSGSNSGGADTTGDSGDSSSSDGPMFDEPMLEANFSEALCLDPRTGDYSDAYDCPPGTLIEIRVAGLDNPHAGFRTTFPAPDLCLTVDNDHYGLDDLADLVDCGNEPSGSIPGDRDLAGHGLYYTAFGGYKILIHSNTCEDCVDPGDGHVALSWAEL